MEAADVTVNKVAENNRQDDSMVWIVNIYEKDKY